MKARHVLIVVAVATAGVLVVAAPAYATDWFSGITADALTYAESILEGMRGLVGYVLAVVAICSLIYAVKH